jgi:hypothetical protein
VASAESGRPEVAITGPAAAQWHGMLARRPHGRRRDRAPRTKPRARPGLRVHRRDLSAADVVTLRGLGSRAKGWRRWRARSHSRTVRRSSTAPSSGI